MKSKKSYLLFALPSALLFTFAIVIPFIMGINIAFTDWDGISQTYHYNGLQNFKTFFTDKSVLQPIKNTFIYGIGYTALNNLLSLVLALLLNKWIKGSKILKTVFFIPMVLSSVLAAFVWGYIYKDVFSAVFGINSLLGNPSTVIPGIIIIALWNAVGSNLIIYMAGLDNIPDMYYEASAIDGATLWQQFRYVTLPMLIPTFTICITLTFTTALREFGTVMAATGGGPAGSSETLAIYIYKNLFSFQKAGYGQAVSFVFMIMLALIGTLMLRFFRKREVEY